MNEQRSVQYSAHKYSHWIGLVRNDIKQNALSSFARLMLLFHIQMCGLRCVCVLNEFLSANNFTACHDTSV